MNIAIIPIKSDSKRIPMKMFKEFCDKPLWHRVFSQVANCMAIDKVFISTSDLWFKKLIIENERVLFLERPKELNGDIELTEVMKHVAKDVASTGDNIIQIQANKPLTKASDIMECIKIFEDNNFDSLSTVQEIGTKTIGASATYKSMAICKIWKYETLMNSTKEYSYGDKHCYHRIAKHHIEIDDMEDWRMAEALYKALERGEL